MRGLLCRGVVGMTDCRRLFPCFWSRRRGRALFWKQKFWVEIALRSQEISSTTPVLPMPCEAAKLEGPEFFLLR